MYSFTRKPPWLMLHVVVIAITVTFVLLGRWQLDRLEQRKAENEVIRSRLAAAAAEWDGSDHPPEYSRLRMSGRFVPSEEIFLRSQVYLGQPGFDVLTPLYVDDDTAVIVNRGWVPLDLEEPPATRAAPPGGEVVVTGIVRYPAVEPAGSSGEPPVVAGFDFESLEAWTQGGIERFYLALTAVEPVGGELPVPEDEPRPTNGPHLSYAMQWFAFALIAVAGYAALIRSTALRRSGVRRRGGPRPPR